MAPTSADVEEQAAFDAKIAAVAKAKAVGLTEADLHALGVMA